MKQHVSFVLLAEFDIDQGALLSRQFPTPLGADEQLLAGLMLPDGAEKQSEDWTIFFLNQTPLNTIAPAVSDPPERDPSQPEEESNILYVLSLVRTKHDSTVRRGGIVKAMAICTHLPFIQIFKPVLLIALDDYFRDPSMDCLERLFDSINAMDLTLMPSMSRDEKRIMRVSDRKDVFIEKFMSQQDSLTSRYKWAQNSQISVEDPDSKVRFGARSRTRSVSSTSSRSSASHAASSTLRRQDMTIYDKVEKLSDSRRGEVPRQSKRSTGASSEESARNIPTIKDTHYYDTSITYKHLTLPIRVPLFTFGEEVGEYSMIQLIQTFSAPGAMVQGPLHPHLHTNGALTHPIILLFNAIITEKRVLFLSHGKPAGVVSNYVLAAAALVSGCGSILRGLPSRMFPYANLTSKDVVESVPGFIAGVTNPIFENGRVWDLICNIDTGKMTVNKDIPWPTTQVSFPAPPTTSKPGLLKNESSMTSEDDVSIRAPSQTGYVNGQSRSDFTAKPDNADNAFMDEILSAIALHYGENVIRARFTDYVSRFVRLASRYEEEHVGQTTIGFASRPYIEGPPGELGRLGSGLNFWDESGGLRELQLNANRIEGWRRTISYKTYQLDFKLYSLRRSIQGFDLVHQVWRLRHARHMSDREVDLIMKTFMEHVQTYEQVAEFLAHFPTHAGGLVPLALVLFHHRESIRDIAVEVLNVLRAYPIGYQFLQSLNPFQRFAYVRMTCVREDRIVKVVGGSLQPPLPSRTPERC